MSTSHFPLPGAYASLVQVVAHDCINVLLRVRRPFAVWRYDSREECFSERVSGIPKLPPTKSHEQRGIPVYLEPLTQSPPLQQATRFCLVSSLPFSSFIFLP